MKVAFPAQYDSERYQSNYAQNHLPSTLWNTFTGKVKEVSSSAVKTLAHLWQGVPQDRRRYFIRKAGYWNTLEDERRSDFFGRLITRESQREDWYQKSQYIAEFWNALSSAGFIYVGVQNSSPELVFAGVGSMMSHAIPKQWLLTLDKIGALSVVSKLFREYQVVASHPSLIGPLAAVGGVFILDIYLATAKPKAWSHVAWHISSAYVSHLVFQTLKK